MKIQDSCKKQDSHKNNDNISESELTQNNQIATVSTSAIGQKRGFSDCFFKKCC